MNNKPTASKIVLGDRKYIIDKKQNEDNSATYMFHGEDGDAQMTVYVISPGIKIIHQAAHTDCAYRKTAKKNNTIEIHHCREGRMERSFKDGYFFLMPGDLSIDIGKSEYEKYIFPLRHYHGITISIDTDTAPKCFSCFLTDISVQPMKVAKKLCEERDFFLIRSKDYIEHIFSEMYNVPCENKKGYYKIKVLELLLVLSGIDPKENKLNTHTLSGVQVELAKRVASFIADNTDSHITIPIISQKFNVSATHLQNAFKGVYGVPVFSYMRIHKMNVAALQLIQTDKTVMEIASECGYDNASKFASAFCEIMGETPLEYRKAHRHINN